VAENFIVACCSFLGSERKAWLYVRECEGEMKVGWAMCAAGRVSVTVEREMRTR